MGWRAFSVRGIGMFEVRYMEDFLKEDKMAEEEGFVETGIVAPSDAGTDRFREAMEGDWRERICYKELHWREQLKWNIIECYDAVKKAAAIVRERKPKWRRILERVLKITESLIYIAGRLCVPKIKI